MKVARSIGLREVRLEDLPEPALPDDGVVCRVLASGVCGSDVNDAYIAPKLPAVLGHEVVGEVVAAGPRARGVETGARVVVQHHVPCGACETCRAGRETLCRQFRSTNIDPGGFAERVAVRGPLVGELLDIDGLDPAVGTFAEPLGCALRALGRAGVGGDDALLVCGLGSAGLLVTAASRAGATYVSEPRPERRAHAAAPDHAGEPVDVAIVCTPAADAIAYAVDALRPGGRLLLYATPPAEGAPAPVDWWALFRRELTVLTSWGAGPPDVRAALALLASGEVDPRPWITHRVALEETGRALELQRSGEAIKVVISP